jgi:cytochrome P450
MPQKNQVPLAHTPSLDVDPFDLTVMLDPYECDAQVREAAPAVWLPKYGFWAVGRHQNVQAIFGDYTNFSSAAGTGLTHNRKETPWRKPSIILEVDPPAHTRARAVLSRILSPASVAKLRNGFQAEADRLVDELVERRTFDGATDLAQAFAMKVMPDAVGLPEKGRENLLPYANLNFNAMGPKNALYHNAVAAAGNAPQWVEFQCRRENLASEGFGAQIYEAVDEGEIDADDAGLLVRVFLTASLDTTIFGMGLGLHAFARNPDQWDILRSEPTLARAAFDEVLRYTAPSPFIGRTTTTDVEVDGVQLGADEKVILFVAAANRDPRRWENPDNFDIRRRATGHMAFGTGVHGCVGQMVARLESEVLLNALTRKVRHIELAGEPELRPTNWLRGFAKLPLTVTPV